MRKTPEAACMAALTDETPVSPVGRVHKPSVKRRWWPETDGQEHPVVTVNANTLGKDELWALAQSALEGINGPVTR